MLFEISPLTQEYEQICTLLISSQILKQYSWRSLLLGPYLTNWRSPTARISKNPAEIPLGPLAGFLAEMTTIHDWNHWSSSSPPTYSALFSFRVKTKENLITSQLDGKITRAPRWEKRRVKKKNWFLFSFLVNSSLSSGQLVKMCRRRKKYHFIRNKNISWLNILSNLSNVFPRPINALDLSV